MAAVVFPAGIPWPGDGGGGMNSSRQSPSGVGAKARPYSRQQHRFGSFCRNSGHKLACGDWHIPREEL